MFNSVAMTTTTTFRGDRLRQKRERLGLTQTELSERVNAGTNQIYLYENKKSDPNSRMLISLSRELGVTTDWLLGLVDEPNQHVQENDLSSDERDLLAAYRRGDVKIAMRLILDNEQGE